MSQHFKLEEKKPKIQPFWFDLYVGYKMLIFYYRPVGNLVEHHYMILQLINQHFKLGGKKNPTILAFWFNLYVRYKILTFIIFW